MYTEFVSFFERNFLLSILIGVLIFLIFIVEIANQTRIYIYRLRGIYPQKNLETEEDVRRLAKTGEISLAIRCHRTMHGGTLKDAKRIVEEFQLENRVA
jgi:hypothetical protein